MPYRWAKFRFEQNVLATISQKRHALANLFIGNFQYVVLHAPEASTLLTVPHHQLEHVFQEIFSNTIHTKCTHVNQMHNYTSREMHDLWSENTVTAKFPFLLHLWGGETAQKASGKLRKNQGLKEMAGRFLDTFALHLGAVADPCDSFCSENCCRVCRCAEVLPETQVPETPQGASCTVRSRSSVQPRSETWRMHLPIISSVSPFKNSGTKAVGLPAWLTYFCV